jgi:hypothetical protein
MGKSKKKPEPGIIWTTDDAIPELVLRAISGDYDYDGDLEITEFYEKLTKLQKAAVDCTLIRLSGWSMKTYITAMRAKKLPDDLERSTENPFAILDGIISDSDLKVKT